MSLNFEIQQLLHDLHLTEQTADCLSIPTDPILEAKKFLELIPQLFDKIKHGEPGHKAWLEEAVECHFLGKPMPDYVAK